MVKKYYAVRKGYKPGIYTSWKNCEKQVKGFKGCEFKSFKTKEEAIKFLNKQSKPKKPKPNFITNGEMFYVVKKGWNPGIYTKWKDCELQIKNFQNPKFRKFYEVEKAEEYFLGKQFFNRKNSCIKQSIS